MPGTIEELIFEFMDQCKFIFFPEQWNQFFLECSKNEIFTLFLVYRRGQVNMTEIADYLEVPLNTVTGVVGRLEKKEIILRKRSVEDKRVVTICLSEKGKLFIEKELLLMEEYFSKILNILSEEEKLTLFKVAGKVFRLLETEGNKKIKKIQEKTIRKIVIE
ncbi:MAG: MarR family winged helix-turn-helix transcriptional regulator [Eubacteriaceae bacterium]